MATLSDIRGWWFPQVAGERALRDQAPAAPARTKLRAMPNEDLYFHSKRIDNSRVVRQADPAARGRCWSAIGVACVLTVLLGSLLAPNVASILAGYQIQALKADRERLLNERRVLLVEEASLSAPGRLDVLAKERAMKQPEAGQVVHAETGANAPVASLGTAAE